MKVKLALLVASFSSLFFQSVQAQVTTGTPFLGSFAGGPDSVNLGNLNVNWVLPLINKAGRGVPFVIAPTYDSSVWYPVTSGSTQTWQPVNNYGWNGMPSGYGGYYTYQTSAPQQEPCGSPGYYFTIVFYSNYVYYDAHGTAHPFPSSINPYTVTYGPQGCQQPEQGSGAEWGTATDGSGYSITAYPGGWASINDAKGNGVLLNGGSGPTYQEDMNGNYITCTSSSCTDTLNTTAMSVSGSPSAPPLELTVPGVSTPYKIYYTNKTVRTNFGCSNVHEYGPVTVPLVTSIALPDGREYQVKYETTPGYSGDVTGRIVSITLPTDTSGGPTITYSYSGGSNGIECTDGSTPTLTRTDPNGQWTYSRAQSGSAWITTITAPAIAGVQDVTKVAFGTMTSGGVTNFYEVGRQINSGSSSLQETVLTCYQTIATGCPTKYSDAVSNPNVSSLAGQVVYTQVPDNTGYTAGFISKYDSLGFQSEQDTYDFGSLNTGTFSSSPLLIHMTIPKQFGGATDVTTGAYIQTFDRLEYDYITGSGGQAQTFTQYNFDETGTVSSGAPQRSGGICSPTCPPLGNVTSVYSWVSGGNPGSGGITGTYLTSKYKNFDTGLVQVATDVNSGTGTYVYNGTGGCADAFPTSITSTTGNSGVTSLTTSATWNCNGGIQATTVDANNNTTTYTYSGDPFWRPSSVKNNATGAITNYAYQTSSSDTTSSSMNFNGTTSTSTQVTTYDALGRVIDQQTEQAPGALSSGTFDTVSTTYDAVGRTSFVSLACSAALSQSCATGSGNPGTLYAYDALNRITKATDGGGGYVQYTYEPSSSDVLLTVGPQTSGENLKERMLHYNGAGWLRFVCEIITSTQPGGGNCDETATGGKALTTAASGYLTEYDYDSAGRLYTVKQNYEQTSNKIQTRSVTYDGLSRKTSETIPEWSDGSGAAGTSSYTYDSDSAGKCGGTYAGDLVKTVDNNGDIICNTYDKLHRLLSITLNSSSTYYSATGWTYFVYDAATYSGTAMSNAKGTIAEAYTCPPGGCGTKRTDEYFSTSPITSGGMKGGIQQDMWQSTPHSSGYFHTTDSYFPNGTVGAVASQLGSSSFGLPNTTITVDGEGRPYTVSDGTKSLVQETDYFPGSSLLKDVLYGNAPLGSDDGNLYSYDSSTNRLTQEQVWVGNNVLEFQPTWNSNGSLKQIYFDDTSGLAPNSNETCTYSADDLMRLASVNCGTSTWAQNFSYDQFGNIDKTNAGGATSYTATYNSTTNQVSSGISPSPTYDKNGNQTNLTAISGSVGWNAMNRPITINGTGATYDAFGRMIETGVSTYQEYVYSPAGSEIAIYGGTGGSLLKGMIPLPGGDIAIYSGNSVLQYLRRKNWLGSTIATSAWGQTIQIETGYAPFAETYNEYTASGASQDRSFASMDQDVVSGNLGTGVDDALFRKLDPSAGRWLSPDPAGWGAVNLTNPQSLNRYAYSLNDPALMVDPTGLDGFVVANGCVYYDFSYQWTDAGGSIYTNPTEITLFCGVPSGIGPGIVWTPGEPGGPGPGNNGGGGGGGGGGAPNNANPPLQICTGEGRGLSGNTALSGLQGGIPGQTVEPGTAAVIPQQFGMTSGVELAPYAPYISGWIGGARFSGVTDVIGGTSPIPGVNVRTALQQLFPGQLILEIPGAADQGANAPVDMTVPQPMGCPTGTSPANLADPIVPQPGSPVPAVARRVQW